MPTFYGSEKETLYNQNKASQHTSFKTVRQLQKEKHVLVPMLYM